jgi:hypothetical protein
MDPMINEIKAVLKNARRNVAQQVNNELIVAGREHEAFSV